MKISDRLKSATLWPGSYLALADKYHYLTRDMLVEKRNSLRRCDDLTPNEKDFLTALEAELGIQTC